MRILLRQQVGQLYLQPNGDWTTERETAREFTSSAVAYYWALEKRLLGIEVLLAFNNPEYDFVTMRSGPWSAT